MLKILAGGLISLCGWSLLVEDIETKMTEYDSDVIPPIDNVSIILPTYNEGPFIQTCVSSLRNQSIIQKYPQLFEIILVDSFSTDNTVNLARPYVDNILQAPKGKLTSKNIGIDNSNCNIIVSVDGDSFYPYHWLNTLLKPFSYNEKVAAVVGSTFDYNIPNIPGQVYTFLSSLERYAINPKRIHGRNSAYWKHLYYLAGKYDDNVDQMDVNEMIKEEELNFGKKLSEYGDIIFKLNASCYHYGGFKFSCRGGFGNKEICDRYGFGIDRF